MEPRMGVSPLRKVHSRTRHSLLSSRRPSGRQNHLHHTNHILKTSLNTVENFGLPLPVLVTETLTFADGKSHISARLNADGWGWIVCGRRLLVWQYNPSSASSSPSPVTCYELTLPQTDLAHKAELVCVFNSPDSQTPSCVGVSPEGVVRYWHSVAHEESYAEKTADLHGQECDTLVDANPVGCALATTTCTVVVVQCNVAAGRHTITTRALQGSGGWLGGLGRRVSSLFFSAMPSSNSTETKLVGVAALSGSQYEEDIRICVVAGLCAQIWQLGPNEKLSAEIDLQRTLRDAFSHASMFPPGDSNSLDVHILDMQSWNGGLLLFAAAINTVRSPQMRYALAHICTDEELGSGQLLGFIPLQASVGAAGRFNPDALSTGGPHMMATSTHAMLYDRSRIIVVSSILPNDKPDVIELNSNNDQIYGSGLYFNIPIFFSKANGVISVLSNEKAQEISLSNSPMASPRPSDAFDGHLSLYEIDPKAVVEASESAGQSTTAELLKAAFLHHVRRQHTDSKMLLHKLFPPSEETTMVNSPLDRTVLAIATDLVNDIPASDPRWNKMNIGNSGAALGSSSSMQIGLQLQDKRKAFSHLLEFLKASGLWNRLGGVTSANAISVPTVLMLRSLAEQLTTAIALRTLQQQPQHQHEVDTVIRQVMTANHEREDDLYSSTALSSSDLFYKNVSSIERAIAQAVKWCNDQDVSGCAPPALSQLITKVNHVIIAVIQEIIKYRHQHSSFYDITPSALKFNLEHTTWTSIPEKGHLFSALRSQQILSAKRARRAPIELRAELRFQAMALAAAALEFIKERAENFPKDSKRGQAIMKEYSDIRAEMIKPFVDDEEYEHAYNLAEKFHDFDTLVTICEKVNNREKLYHYMNKYEKLGFHQCAFKWFMKQGRGGQASLLKAFPHHENSLSQWLASQNMEMSENINMAVDQPIPKNKLSKPIESTMKAIDGIDLLWLHQLRADRWLDAAHTLLQLAENETESANRMTIQASLAKLCAYSNKNENESSQQIIDEVVTSANYKLLLSAHHALPPELIQAHNLDIDNLPVLKPREIIDMFATYSKVGLTEYDYSRALELCDLILNSEPTATHKDVMELRRRLWCATILIDTWKEYEEDAPITAIQNKMFFKVVNAIHLMDCNLEDCLLPLDELLESPELENLNKNKIFLYLMKMGYEHVQRAESDILMD